MENRPEVEQQSPQPVEANDDDARYQELRRAFGRVVNPEFWNVEPSQLQQMEAADLVLVEYENLRGSIFRSSGPLVIGRTSVAFHPQEYRAIVRSPRSFAKDIYANTQAARSLDPQITRRDEKAKRSVEHAIDSKQERLTKVLKGVNEELGWLNILQAEAASPGFAHYRESKMLMLAAAARYISFAKMLEVARLQNGWDEDTFRRAENAQITRLLSGGQRDKVKYWRQMLGLAERYGRARRGIIRQRLTAIGRLKDKY